MKEYTNAVDRWQAKNLDRIVIKTHKEDCIPERVEALVAAGVIKSRQAFIIDALMVKLAEYEDALTQSETQSPQSETQSPQVE